ncbi:IS701 family transposase [Streptomyces sp. NPDC056255]|uniref:IS701 family transposase n=1 Tax=Streptomyces sp. NPDC056255 TaxID=3345764 RepID=UPI0035D7A4C4
MYELTQQRSQQLRAFISELFVELPRSDQRRWATAYLEGLLATPGKKTLRRIAATLGASPTASQSLHQFVNASPWGWEPVRDQLARWAAQHVNPDALVIDMAYIRKRGQQSCGVHTRYIPGQGKSGSCQLGVVAMLAGRQHIAPVDWALHLPGRWLDDEAGRSRAKIPASVTAKTTGQQALELVDARSHHLASSLPVVGNFGSADEVASLALGLTIRARDFVIAVPPTMPVQTERGRTTTAGQLWGRSRPSRAESRGTAWQTAPPMMATATVRVPVSNMPGPEYQLMTVRPSGGDRTAQLWLSNLTDRRRVYLLARRLEASARLISRLEEQFGLADFEGRSYRGWHHYMTLVSAAYAWSEMSHMYEPANLSPSGDSENALR